MTVGYTYYYDANIHSSYPFANTCVGNSMTGVKKQMEVPELNFYYVASIEGKRLLKKQIGSKPLVAHCSQGMPF